MRFRIAILNALFLCATSAVSQIATSPVRAVAPVSRDGEVYVNAVPDKTVQSAIQSACDGTKPGHVLIPPGTFVGPFTPASNCVIEGSGINSTVIQIPASISITSLSNVTLKGFTVDAGVARTPAAHFCSAVPSVANAIDITDSNHVILDEMEVRNTLGNAISVSGGDQYIDIRNSVADFFGCALSSEDSSHRPLGVIGGGFVTSPEHRAGNSHVKFFNDIAHDGNTGFETFPSSTAANISSDVVWESDRSYGNANDGFLAQSVGVGTNALMQGFRWENNESSCNGWTPNWSNSNCAPFGLLQAGEHKSFNGEGFDLNSPLLDQPQVIGNRSHDNFGEGFDNTPQQQSRVNTSGKTVTWLPCSAKIPVCDHFNPAWTANQAVQINGTDYLISGVSGTTMTLTTSAGEQTAARFIGVGYERATLTDNYAYNNGRGNPCKVCGAGFADISYGSTYTGNVAYLNNAAGFIDQISSLITHDGDKSFDNNRSNGPEKYGFYAQAALSPKYLGVSTHESEADGPQQYALHLDGQTTNGYAESSSLCNSKSCNPSATVLIAPGSSNSVSSAKGRRGP
ncbi:MAG: hypothetical protein WB729_16365 [Candidatus Sulfotelmatobacter sp.]